jgi:hypothetical protein
MLPEEVSSYETCNHFIIELSYAESFATLSHINTQMETFDVVGGSVSFDGAGSYRGWLGVKFGGELELDATTTIQPYFMAGPWKEFSGQRITTL